MAKKRSGHSKKSTDWLGRPVIKHYNSKGEKTGYSKKGRTFFGAPITERYNAKGEKTGYNKKSTTFFGTPITERYNAEGEKTGYNKKGSTFLGTPTTERYNAKGEKTGYSKQGSTFFGTPITEHFNTSTSAPPMPPRTSADTYSPGVSGASSSRGTKSSGSGWGGLFACAAILMTMLIGGSLWRALTQQQSPAVRSRPVPVRANAPAPPSAVKVKFRDDASTIPALLDARNKLLDAVLRRDLPAVLTSVDPAVRVGFGGDGGHAAFTKCFGLENVDSKGWQTLEFILRHGGRLEKGMNFYVPYMWNLPQIPDSENWVVAFGDRTPLRASPDSDAKVVADVRQEVVRLLETRWPQSDSSVKEPWSRIRTTNGKDGWVPRAMTYSGYDLRLVFSLQQGRWIVSGVFSGD